MVSVVSYIWTGATFGILPSFNIEYGQDCFRPPEPHHIVDNSEGVGSDLS
jgi:hypothetical protein